jgi:hypothetical protein
MTADEIALSSKHQFDMSSIIMKSSVFAAYLASLRLQYRRPVGQPN